MGRPAARVQAHQGMERRDGLRPQDVLRCFGCCHESLLALRREAASYFFLDFCFVVS